MIGSLMRGFGITNSTPIPTQCNGTIIGYWGRIFKVTVFLFIERNHYKSGKRGWLGAGLIQSWDCVCCDEFMFRHEARAIVISCQVR